MLATSFTIFCKLNINHQEHIGYLKALLISLIVVENCYQSKHEPNFVIHL